MELKILVLDDSLERLIIFRKNIEENLGVLNANYTENANDAIECLSLNPEYDYIFLDHDLGVEGYPNGAGMVWDAVNNGMTVVDWIVSNNYKKEVSIIVHSWNIPRGKEMTSKLTDAGYSAIQVPGVWNSIGK